MEKSWETLILNESLLRKYVLFFTFIYCSCYLCPIAYLLVSEVLCCIILYLKQVSNWVMIDIILVSKSLTQEVTWNFMFEGKIKSENKQVLIRVLELTLGSCFRGDWF